ncbi:MAG: two-component system cell cycle response regulator [Psychromonas sp.]|jgi:two-component system cell cycle response regulator|uniref:GGDEF domain-containing protein n=1 Tax=Psychromonas sp. TaxID=1884585 RepID=UPI0039E5AB9E
MFSFEQIHVIMQALPDPVFILTRSGKYAAVFGGTDSRYYHDGSFLVGAYIRDVLNEQKANWFMAEIERALTDKRLQVVEYGLAGSDVKNLHEDGPSEVIWFEGRVQALQFKVDDEDAVLWVASNISERHALEQRLLSLSETDQLTGLWNRRHFECISAQELKLARRNHYPISLLMLDIDHFKLINDTQGHGSGDAVLIEIASIITACMRESDTITRWGGEEFTVLMPYTKLNGALKSAEKLRLSIQHHCFSYGISVTISVGVAQWRLKSESVEKLLSRADEGLYIAKRNGRNRVEVSQNRLREAIHTQR